MNINNPKNSSQIGSNKKKLKYLMNHRKGFAFNSNLFSDSGVPVVKASDLKGNQIMKSSFFIPKELVYKFKDIYLKKEDIIISTVGSKYTVRESAVGQIAKVTSELDGSLLNQNMVCIRLNNNLQISNNYIFYSLLSNEYRSHLDISSHGTANQSSLNLEDILNYEIFLPSFNEQKLISEYLDKKTSQIDLLIQKIENKIQLIKEQKTSLINKYVTKGLNPDVEMKESGIEWIGEIPKHWKIMKLKYFAEIKTGRDPSKIYYENGLYDVLGTGGIIGKTNQTMFNQTSLILGRKGTIDKPFIQKNPFWISDVVYYTESKSYITPEYLWFLFTQIDFSFYSYGSTLPSMSKDDYENMKFPIPSKEEVFDIGKLIEKTLISKDKLIKQNNRKKDLLKEYRQSLISSVVTGKIRITEDMI